MVKDLFSEGAEHYAQARPHYPQALYDYLLSFVVEKHHAWDCATGNGQAAAMLSPHFNSVDATDISEAQLAHAVRKDNIVYTNTPAEKTPFNADRFNLITVAQAYHWFDFQAFQQEAQRVAKAGAVIAIWGYNHVRTGNKHIDNWYKNFYENITGPYWDPERKFLDEAYKTIPFPFEPAGEKQFVASLQWSLEQYKAYLHTWSSVKHFIRKNGYSPFEGIENSLDEYWGEKRLTVEFPLFLRLGRISK